MNEFLKKLAILIDRTGKFYLVSLSPAIMSLACTTNLSAHGALCSRESGLNRGERHHLPVTLHLFSPSWVRKFRSKQLNSLGRWPTVVSLLYINAVYNDGLGKPVSQLGPRLTADDNLFDGGEGWLVKTPLGVSTLWVRRYCPSSLAVQLLLTCSNLFKHEGKWF